MSRRRNRARVRRPPPLQAMLLAALLGLAAAAHAADEDGSAALFPADRVLVVRLELAEEDWDTLRRQVRDKEAGVYGRGCLRHPSPQAYTYFPARLFLDDREALPVAVRKKGFYGSADTERPALKVHLARYDKQQRLLGLRKLTLNNAKEDPALVRQCLGYALYRRAGLPAPRCGFASVTVNGRHLGVYVNVESVDRVFTRRHFGAGGCLWEGAVSDFRTGWVRTFQFKEGDEEPCRVQLGDLLAALAAPDQDLEAALAARVDLDTFLTFWALEALIENGDGYAAAANNFFIHQGRGGDRLRFVPWGIDGIMGDAGTFCEPFPEMVYTYGFLALRLYLLPTWATRYQTRLRDLIARLWDEDALLAEVERLAVLIRPHLSAAQGRALPAGLDGLETFICRRRSVLEHELAGPPPTRGLFLADPPCRPRSRGP